ncbi:MAG TPA: UdgX family uracil-DNA binding protein [Thermoleophilaceae bacterium]|nr:UdgX family uracil-DNA binding protein [Thermoleophilaceae bacterium]
MAVAEPMDATPFLPEAGATLDELARAVEECRGCPLWRGTTQAVLGEGPLDARVVLVGEQPGDREDVEGRPFVGPAGHELDRALEEAGIDRDDAYVTNAVKHFKFKERGKRRIHDKPTYTEVGACLPWLERELEQLRPQALVALGATAAQGLLGRDFRVTRQHGQLVESELAPLVTATLHPSAILRARSVEARREMHQTLVEDLTAVAKRLD